MKHFRFNAEAVIPLPIYPASTPIILLTALLQVREC